MVTRNAHVEDIAVFLAERGLGAVPVHRVKRPASKAEVVCDPRWTAGLQEAEDEGRLGRLAESGASPVILFVDDNISEHLDEDIRTATNVRRFLFARSG